MATTIVWAGAAVMIFLIGFACGMLAAWRRYALALEDRDAESKRASEAVSGYMMQGVDFNKQILGILDAQRKMPRTVSVDWDLLTRAANGAGFALIKAEPRALERVN